MLSTLTSKIYEFEDFRLVPGEGLLLHNGTPISLNPKAFAVLSMLVEHHGHLLSKSDIMDAIWEGAFVEEGAISKAVWFVRNALGDNSKERFIKTIPRRGYRFIAPVSVVSGSGAYRLLDLHGIANTKPEFVSGLEESYTKGSAGTGSVIVIGTEDPEAPATTIHAAVKNSTLHRARLPLRAAGLLLLLTAVVLLSYLFIPYRPLRTAVPSERHPVRSLAITSLQNLSGGDQDYFAHGFTSALIDALVRTTGFNIISQPVEDRSTSPDSLNGIARELAVDSILTGSVVVNNNAVAVTIKVWSVHSQSFEWSKEFEGTRDDIGGLQLSIATQIATALGNQAAADPVKLQPAVRKVPPAAEDAYFKGVYYFDTATNLAKKGDKTALLLKAITEFERAISIDTRYAEAYASLARTYHWLGSNGNPEAYVKSKMAATAAIELDPVNAKAHASLAWVFWRHEWEWQLAEAEYKQALALSGGAASPLGHGYALFISTQGRHNEAIEIMRRHEESNPLSIAGKVSSAYIKLRARRYDAAEVDFRRILEFDPQQAPALSGLAITLTCLSRFGDAIAVARRVNNNNDNPAQRLTLAWVYAKAGRVKDATALLGKVEGQFRGDYSQNDAFAIAKVYAGLGEADKSFAWLEKAFAVRSQYLVFLGVSPEFDNLGGDPRFADMLKRVGVPGR